jgi:hypothetical protein
MGSGCFFNYVMKALLMEEDNVCTKLFKNVSTFVSLTFLDLLDQNAPAPLFFV